MDWWIGLAGSGLIAGAAYAKRSLSLSGAIAAIIMGTGMVALGSAVWFGTLVAFFVSSTLLSKLKSKAKASAESGYEKGARRDAGQVWANGGLGFALCMLHALYPDPLWFAAFVGVMAAANADTWATEIGSLSRSAPRSIRTGRKVAPGTSGGVSALGFAATVAGGLFIGAAAWLLQWADAALGLESAAAGVSPLLLLMLGALGGTAGSLADSALGATLQQMFRCRICGRDVEQPRHCGAPAERLRGVPGLGNDAVNVLGTAIGGAAALLLGLALL